MVNADKAGVLVKMTSFWTAAMLQIALVVSLLFIAV